MNCRNQVARNRCGAWVILRIVLLALAVAAGTGCRRDRIAPGNVADLTATAGDSQVLLAWSNPADTDLAGVKVLRNTGQYPADPDDGVVVHNGPGQQATDTGLSNGTPYYYAVFAYDNVPNFSSGVKATAVPTAPGAQPEILEGYLRLEDALHGQPGTLLPAVQVAALVELVLESEEDYRAGDACLAASVLQEYEALARQARLDFGGDPAAAGGFEQLYNDGRRLRYEMIVGTPLGVPCPGQERIGMEAGASADPAGMDNTKLLSTARFGEPVLLTVAVGAEVFTQAFVPGADVLVGQPGLPGVPVLRRLIAAPEGATATVRLPAIEEAEIIHCNLYPFQEPVHDYLEVPETGDPVPPGEPAFVRDDLAYQEDAFFPPNPVTLTPLGAMRGLNVYLLEVRAGQYNPLRQELLLFKSLDVDIRFSGGSGFFIRDTATHDFESDWDTYGGSVLNAAILSVYVGEAVVPGVGEEFMILTPPALSVAAKKLADWKNTKGILTKVFQVGEGTGFLTSQDILQMIKNEYTTSFIRPSYVLLFGDSNLIPTFYEVPSGDVGSDTIGTDHPYACVDGVLTNLPDLALGRIPVKEVAGANAVVDKIIQYESSPPGAGFEAFYQNAAIISAFWCCRQGVGKYGTEIHTNIQAAEFVRDHLMGRGYDVERIYSYLPWFASSTPGYYADGSVLPPDLGPTGDFSWDGATEGILDAFDSGKFLIIQRDDGWPGGWHDPNMNTIDAGSLTNAPMLPVVFSMSSANGLFDNETAGGALNTKPESTYFAESLLRKANGGAVGILAPTRKTADVANSAMLRGFVDGIWPDTIPAFGAPKAHKRLGDILHHGKMYLLTQGGFAIEGVWWSDVGDGLRMWHCIGDPTLQLWTSFPHTTAFPSTLTATLAETGIAIENAAGAAGDRITALQADSDGAMRPIGRGTIGPDGTVLLPYFSRPIPDADIQFSIESEGSPAVAMVLRPLKKEQAE